MAGPIAITASMLTSASSRKIPLSSPKRSNPTTRSARTQPRSVSPFTKRHCFRRNITAALSSASMVHGTEIPSAAIKSYLFRSKTVYPTVLLKMFSPASSTKTATLRVAPSASSWTARALFSWQMMSATKSGASHPPSNPVIAGGGRSNAASDRLF